MSIFSFRPQREFDDFSMRDLDRLPNRAMARDVFKIKRSHDNARVIADVVRAMQDYPVIVRQRDGSILYEEPERHEIGAACEVLPLAQPPQDFIDVNSTVLERRPPSSFPLGSHVRVVRREIPHTDTTATNPKAIAS